MLFVMADVGARMEDEEARAKPRGAAEFFTATLVRHPKTGNLVTCPSSSPEHGGLVAGPAMDTQIIRALYAALLEAVRNDVPPETVRKIAPELIYLALRGRREGEVRFLRENLLPEEKRNLSVSTAGYAIRRVWWKLRKYRPNEKLRGYVRGAKGGAGQ